MKNRARSFPLIIAVIAFLFILNPFKTHAASSADTGAQSEQLSDRVRTITYNGYNAKSTFLYQDKYFRQPVLEIPAGTQMEILSKDLKLGYIRVRYDDRNFYIRQELMVYTSCNFTRLKYNTQQKLTFVNGYKSSTKFLIWISLYTQEVNVFKGKKGKWKLIKIFPCTGGSHLRRTPKGVFKVGRKEKRWNYYNRYLSYITRFKGRNAFHSRIHRKKAYGGGYYYPELGAPGSNGCIRLYDKDAKYIYRKIPKGTTVISY